MNNSKIKPTLRKILLPVGIFYVVALFIYVCLVYFIRTVGMDGGEVFDGLGRKLSDAPFVIHAVFGQEREWAGWGWFLVDMTIFWGSIGLIAQIYKWLQD